MDRAFFQPVNQASQCYSDRIAPSTWNLYKADILREYSLGGKYGIARAKKWITEQRIPGFNPTRKQLELQLNKHWLRPAPVETANVVAERRRIQENEELGYTTMQASSAELRSGIPLNEWATSPEVAAQKEIDQTGDLWSDSSKSEANPVSHEKQLPSTREEQPMPTEFNVERIYDSQDSHLVPKPDRFGTVWLGPGAQDEWLQNQFNIKSYRHAQNEWLSPEVLLLALIDVNESSLVTPELLTIQDSECYNIFSTEKHQLDQSSRLYAGLQPMTKPRIELKIILFKLNFIEIRWSTSQVRDFQSDPRNLFQCSLYYKEDLALIKEAADYFSSGFHDSISFHLYLLLWLIAYRCPKWEKNVNLLISCVWTAKAQSELQLARELLEHSILRLADIESPHFEEFLLRVALMKLYLSLGEINDWENQRQWIFRNYRNPKEMVMILTQAIQSQNLRLTFFTYAIIHYACCCWDNNHVRRMITFQSSRAIDYGHLNELVGESLEEISQILISHTPGPVMVRSGTSGNICIRDCLEWCLAVLEDDNRWGLFRSHPLPKHLKEWRSNTISQHWAEPASLFLYLWSQWKKRLHTVGCFTWNENIATSLGLSITELLSETVSLILRHSAVEDVSQLTSSIKSKDILLIQRWCKGAETLLRMDDWELAQAFLSSYTSPKRDTTEEKPDGFDIEQYTNDCRIRFLAGIREVFPFRLSQPQPFHVRDSITSALSIEQTLASSQSSETLRSMKRIAKYTAEQSQCDISTSSGWKTVVHKISGQIRGTG